MSGLFPGQSTPSAPSTPAPASGGLMGQTADPYAVYGQLGVANPYLSALNNRFGWDPSGLAYGTDMKASPSWYLPPVVYPNTTTPSFGGGAGTTTNAAASSMYRPISSGAPRVNLSSLQTQWNALTPSQQKSEYQDPYWYPYAGL